MHNVFVLEFEAFSNEFLSLFGGVPMMPRQENGRNYSYAVFPDIGSAAEWSDGLSPRPEVTATLPDGMVFVRQEQQRET